VTAVTCGKSVALAEKYSAGISDFGRRICVGSGHPRAHLHTHELKCPGTMTVNIHLVVGAERQREKKMVQGIDIKLF
jgi:hypothetical protein